MEKRTFALLLLQSLEHERCAVAVYNAALRCATNDALREEWEQYRAEARDHVDVLSEVCEALNLDPQTATNERDALRDLCGRIIATIEHGAAKGTAEPAQLIACEGVLLMESKDHPNWALLGAQARRVLGASHAALGDACEQMDGEKEEHLYSARNWASDLWNERLGVATAVSEPSTTQEAMSRVRRRVGF